MRSKAILLTALRKPLDDRRLADSRRPNDDRVILGAARQHADHATNLFVAAFTRWEEGTEIGPRRLRQRHAVRPARTDDRVNLAGLGPGDEVLAVLCQRVERRLGGFGRDLLAPAHLRDRRGERCGVNAGCRGTEEAQ